MERIHACGRSGNFGTDLGTCVEVELQSLLPLHHELFKKADNNPWGVDFQQERISKHTSGWLFRL